MKLAVVGSRSFEDYWTLVNVINEINEESPVTEIISGGARGADQMAYEYAIHHSIPYKEFPAEWDKYGKKAGPIRNKLIVEEADMVLAFWDGVSSGTKSSIRFSEELKKPYRIVLF